MKKITLILIAILSLGSLFAQPSNFIFFSEDGYPFYVIMNGVKQNQNAQTNVRVENLTSPSYKAKIIFEDKTIPSINKNVYTKPGIEVTYRIKKNRKGENVVRYYTENPITYEPVVIVDNNENDNVVIVRDETYDNNSGGVHIDIDLNDNGGGVNINTPDGDVSINADININGGSVTYDESISDSETNYYIEENTKEQIYNMPGYNGAIGCNWPVENRDFLRMKQSINSKDFSSDKLRVAKQIINSNCLTAQQVKEIVSLFDFESEKLEFAKYAYKHTFDINNYYIINDAFEFSSSIEKLDNYINTVHWE